ncbi:MAG: site-2 protease family protein, partial [Calditrichota bacterium]
FRLGDPTAARAGRLTLNPLAHLDPIGTIMLFLVHFGWARPVPVNPHYFKRPQIGMIWVSLAGPGANVILAALLGLSLRILLATNIITPFSFFYLGLTFAVFINLMLAFFNLIPIPPLDGSKVVQGLLPLRYQEAWMKFEKFGFLILIGIIFFGNWLRFPIFETTILPLSLLFYDIFTGGAPLVGI